MSTLIRNSAENVTARHTEAFSPGSDGNHYRRKSLSADAEQWLLAPSTKAELFGQYWEKRPLVVKSGQLEYFQSLLSFEDIDRVITTLDRLYPAICLNNANDRRLTSSDYTLSVAALAAQKGMR